MRIFFYFIIFIVLFARVAVAKDLENKTKFTIVAGDKKATYYAVASGLCNVFNAHYFKYGYECISVESKGAEGNLHSLANQEADFGVIKTPEFNKFFTKNYSENDSKVNFVARIHDEYLTLLVQKASKIKSISDLNKKSVNIGSSGSSSATIAEKYFSDFYVKPKKIHHLGASKAFQMMCDKKIDAWIYFIGHPNNGYADILKRCDVELISIPRQESENFLSIGVGFFEKSDISKQFYDYLDSDISTISSQTILAARDGMDPDVVNLIKEVFLHYKKELIQENNIFKNIR